MMRKPCVNSGGSDLLKNMAERRQCLTAFRDNEEVRLMRLNRWLFVYR